MHTLLYLVAGVDEECCCLQMKAGDKCHVYDVLYANSGVMQQLQAILEDSNIVKVLVDCRNDSAALMYQKGIEIRNIFDLQVTCITRYISGMRCTVVNHTDL